MKRTKLMVGVLALSSVLLGAGYAAWTDQDIINGTVSTANFCVQFTEEPTLVQGEDYLESNEISEARAELVGAENGNAHAMKFEAKNVKPGVPITYKTTIGNLSSIDAKLTGVKVVPGDDDDQYPAENVKLKVTLDGNGTTGAGKVDYNGSLAGLENNDINFILQEVNEGTTDETPVTFTVEVEDNKVEDESSNPQHDKQSIEFTLTFDWEQTDGVPAPAATQLPTSTSEVQ